MGIRSILSKPFASYIHYQTARWKKNPVAYQQATLKRIVSQASQTIYGKEHGFSDIKTYDDFRNQVPVGDYEMLRSYVDQVRDGHNNVLWPGKPLYFAKTSGTTSGTKYIPITKESVPNHMNSARNALLSYVHETGKSRFLDGKLIFLSGSPEIEEKNGIFIGRLSGIVNHHIPAYLRTNQMPSYETNCMEDWEAKVDRIVEETINQDLTLISGIPPWVQMYFDKLVKKSGGKPIKDIFPNFNLFVYGGVNFEPYRAKLIETIGKNVDSVETYPASEGFIAYQDSQEDPGLLILLNDGIFFEFIKAEEFFDENPSRISIADVEVGVNYALIINSNAGLWGYSIGDTVKFISRNPYRLIVTGRIKHFISAFGEHVIGEEVEKAMKNTLEKFTETEIVEFTVSPNVTPKEGLPLHEWYIEFGKRPSDLSAFKKELNLQLQKLNSYYDDLIAGHVLRELEIISLQKDSFRTYMKSQGKLGGQNKVPRLSNDRKIATAMWDLGLTVH
jgi:hypothetical protein